MIKQFNLALKIFDDIHTQANDDIELSDGWYLVDDDMIDNISASITGGGDVWLDDSGKLTCSGKSPSPLHIWDGSEWVIDHSKETELKAQHIAQLRDKINELRDVKINGGVYVEAVGKWIDTDATAERNILSVKASFDLFGDMEIAWTCADNSILMINKDKLMQIWQVLMTAKTSNHANALRHKAALEQSDNPADYNYTGGWTKTYADYLAEQANG
ncbi:Uncharacterised protein [Pasteurella bettyae]|nr:Uncharacterised protein [Pasteurella bettyae]SUB21308.1 Uncharacterised protein [Pasteurella bettyae]